MIRDLVQKSLDDLINKPCCECDNPHFNEVNGHIVCVNCGFVSDEKVFVVYEPKAFNQAEVDARRHHELWLSFGPHTTLSAYDRDASGKKLPSKVKAKVFRMRREQNRKINSLESNLSKSRLVHKKLKPYFPKHVLTTAWNIYEKCVEEKITRGRSISEVLATSTYLATLITESPVFMFDLVNIIERAGFELPVCKRLKLTKEVESNIMRVRNVIVEKGVLEELGYKLKQPDFFDYVVTYCTRIEMPPPLIRETIDLLKCLDNASTYNLTGKSRQGLIGAAIYCIYEPFESSDELVLFAVSNLKKHVKNNLFTDRVTQRVIGYYMDVTEVTIRERSKDIKVYNLMRFAGDSLRMLDLSEDFKRSVFKSIAKLTSATYEDHFFKFHIGEFSKITGSMIYHLDNSLGPMITKEYGLPDLELESYSRVFNDFGV